MDSLFGRPRSRLFSLVISSLLAFAAFPQTPAQSPSQAPADSATAAPSQDEAARAAERKKRFEAMKQHLEESASTISEVPPADPEQTLFISPAVVNMLVGQSHAFSAFDIDGKTITGSAEWSLSNSYVANLYSAGDPVVFAKDHGTVTIRARVGMHEAEATITVLSSDSLPSGTIIWSIPQIPGYVGKQIVQAMPTATGPALYAVEQGSQGESLIRALTADGRQMWMRRLGPRESFAGFSPGTSFTVVPH